MDKSRFNFKKADLSRIAIAVEPDDYEYIIGLATKHAVSVPTIAQALLKVGLEEHKKEQERSRDVNI